MKHSREIIYENKIFNIGFKKNKYSQITRHDLVQKRDLNQKFKNDKSSLMVKIKTNKQEEEKLLKTIERFKAGFEIFNLVVIDY